MWAFLQIAAGLGAYYLFGHIFLWGRVSEMDRARQERLARELRDGTWLHGANHVNPDPPPEQRIVWTADLEAVYQRTLPTLTVQWRSEFVRRCAPFRHDMPLTKTSRIVSAKVE